MFDGKVETTVEGAEKTADAADQAVVSSVVLAAVDWLAARAAPAAALGFSYGAAWAIWAPTRRPDLAATVVYYGTWTGSVIDGAKVPVLGHFAQNDPYESEDGVAAFEDALRKAGRETEIHRYPGTGHWFAEPSRKDAYDPLAAEVAFGRTLAFLRARLG
jgi:carboxymethylenebutenolidase